MKRGSAEVTHVTFTFPYGEQPALEDISISIGSGDAFLVAGDSGSGKSTFLRLFNALVPESSGGRISGSVVIGGEKAFGMRPRDFAGRVGFVHQDPEAQFAVDQVEADVAFGLNNLELDTVSIRRRIEESLDALGISHLRHRSPATLSGGEKQRVAIAGAIALAPPILVLDEPTSQLDPQGADDVFAALYRLNADLGTTLVFSEHRLERGGPLATGCALLDSGRVARSGAPGDVIADYEGAPPVTRLGRLLNWDPLPLTVRDAKKFPKPTGKLEPPPKASRAPGGVLVRASGLRVAFGRDVRAIENIDFGVHEGEVVALVGRNGSGKSTLLRALAGLLDRRGVQIDGSIDRACRISYVPQNPNTLLSAPTVREEVEETLRLLKRKDPRAVDEWIDKMGLTHLAHRHPRRLSGGERQRVAIAAVAVGGAETLLLDEPTRGIDAASRSRLERAMREHAESGGGVVVATHDIEMAARSTDRVVVLSEGEVIADGPSREVLSGSLFAPQVLRVMPPFLTVAEVAAALRSPHVSEPQATSDNEDHLS